jgi:hypothetical protein
MNDKLDSFIQQENIVNNYISNRRDKIYSTVKSNKISLERSLYELESASEDFRIKNVER